MGWKVAGPDLMGGIKYVSGTSQATAIVTAQAALLGTYMDAFDPVTAKCLLQGSVNKLATAGYHGGNRRKNQFILCDNIACQYIQQLRCDQYP